MEGVESFITTVPFRFHRDQVYRLLNKDYFLKLRTLVTCCATRGHHYAIQQLFLINRVYISASNLVPKEQKRVKICGKRGILLGINLM